MRPPPSDPNPVRGVGAGGEAPICWLNRTWTARWSVGPACRQPPSSASSGPAPPATVPRPFLATRTELEDSCLQVLGFIIGIEVAAALALIFLILMHSGKGGGLSDMFGGRSGAAAQGSTVVERNLDRITVTVAIIFAFTTLILDLRLQ